jgi:hypothetical protein
MGVATEGQTSARPGRCANHPAVARVGVCDVCARPLCLACAVPVRGRVIGPECLSTVLVDDPPLIHVPGPIPPGGERLAFAGFAIVLVVSVLPWSRFGASSRFFGAWTLHWSLVAGLAALLGVLLIGFDRYRPIDPRIGTAALLLLGVVSGVAAFLYHRHPPLLSESTDWPLVAIAGAGLAVLGALIRLFALVKAGRPPASSSSRS